MKYLQTRSFTTYDLEKILVIVLYNQWVVGLSPLPPLHTLAYSFKEYSENYLCCYKDEAWAHTQFESYIFSNFGCSNNY